MEDEIRQYFQSINPIARRVWVDVETCKESYEDAWNYLSSEEQNQVINENIIHPEAVLKYSPLESVSNDGALKPSRRRRIVEDDLGAKWEDEHATPFSWFTQSQLSLAEEGNRETRETVSVSWHDRSAERELSTARVAKPEQKTVTPLPPVFSQPAITEVEEEYQPEPEIQPEDLIHDNVKCAVLEPQCSVATVNAVNVANEVADDDPALDIPRTGFAFLDNW